jgi:hypothetical protein
MAKRYEKNSSIVARQIGNEFILVPIRQNVGDLECIYSLNEVGGRIWQLVNGGRALEDIVAALVAEYNVKASQAEVDVLEFLAQMKEIGAIIEKPEGD